MSSPSDPEPHSPAQDAPPSGPARPPQVLTAAALGFLVALYLLMYAVVLFAATAVLGAVSALVGALYLAIAALDLGGGVLAVAGRGSRILRNGGAVTAGFGALGLILSLTQGGFSLWSVLLIAAGAGIILLLNQPVSRAYFAARGTR